MILLISCLKTVVVCLYFDAYKYGMLIVCLSLLQTQAAVLVKLNLTTVFVVEKFADLKYDWQVCWDGFGSEVDLTLFWKVCFEIAQK